MKRTACAIVSALTLCVTVSNANAVSDISFIEAPYTFGTDAPAYTPLAVADSHSGTLVEGTTANSSGVTRSPYETNSDFPPGAAYNVLSPGGDSGSSAIYDVSSLKVLQFLWGSPDTYNHIQFFASTDGTGTPLTIGPSALSTLSGPDLGCYTGGTCHSLNWDLISFTFNVPVGSMKLINDGTAAFEYAFAAPGEAPSGVPLPGAVWLFGTVVAGAAGASRWQRRKKTA